jgi:ATP-binding cassette, subfamily F, member 3
VLPDYSSGNNEKDIHVHNFNIEIGGLVLLEAADLKLSFGRKYGLSGKNGIGERTCSPVRWCCEAFCILSMVI